MRRRDFYWSLYSTSQKNQLDNLRTDQAEAVFAAIPESLRADYFIWRDGFEGWKPFAEFPELLIALRNVDSGSAETPPPPVKVSQASVAKVPQGTTMAKSQSSPKMAASVKAQGKLKDDTLKTKKTTSATDDTITGRMRGPQKFELNDAESDLSLMETNQGEDRNNFRFDKQFDIRLIVNDKAYSNRTMNISLKGMQFEKPLPKNLPKYFNVEIKRRDKVIPVLCSEIKSPNGTPSTRVKIEVNNYTSGLLELLLGAN